MAKKDNTNNDNYKKLLLEASKTYGITQTNPNRFQLFESSKYSGTDLLFKDSTKKLVDVEEKDTYQEWLGEDYLKDLEALSCPTAGGNINKLQSLVALTWAFIAALCYTGTLFE